MIIINSQFRRIMNELIFRIFYNKGFSTPETPHGSLTNCERIKCWLLPELSLPYLFLILLIKT